MKRIAAFIMIALLAFVFAGCDFKLNNGNPIGIGDEIPTGIDVKSEGNRVKLEAGETLQLSAIVYPQTAPQEVTWSSDDDEIATVSETGLVTGVASGRVTIRAAAKNKPTVTGSIYLTVTQRPNAPTAITIVGPDTLYVNETIKYSYEVEPEDAVFTPEWLSADTSVFTVDANGRLTGVAPGEAELTLKAGEVTAKKTVLVRSREVDPETLTIVGRTEVEVGRSIPLLAVVTPEGARDDVEWTSSDEAIATVDAAGRVWAHAEGTVIITATSLINAELTDSLEITVIDYAIDTTDLQSQIIDVIAKTKNSILGVTNYQGTGSSLKKNSLGSGSVYNAWFVMKDGSIIYDLDEIVTFDDVEKYCYLLMTNKHVVKDAKKVKVYLHEEEIEVDAVTLQMDEKVDLAVVYFEHDRYIRPLPIGDSSKLQSGQFVIAIGNPSGYDFSSSATFGIVSHPQRYLSENTDADDLDDWHNEYIQHDVAINPGNSGGPLLNLAGEIVGMNTLKFASNDIDNMGFSIPSNVITALLPLLEAGEVPERLRLGITSTEVKTVLEGLVEDLEIPVGINYGLYVRDVSAGGHGERAGLQVDDIILSFNGVPIKKTLDLRLQLINLVEGSGVVVPIVIYRNGETITLYLEL